MSHFTDAARVLIERHKNDRPELERTLGRLAWVNRHWGSGREVSHDCQQAMYQAEMRYVSYWEVETDKEARDRLTGDYAAAVAAAMLAELEAPPAAVADTCVPGDRVIDAPANRTEIVHIETGDARKVLLPVDPWPRESKGLMEALGEDPWKRESAGLMEALGPDPNKIQRSAPAVTRSPAKKADALPVDSSPSGEPAGTNDAVQVARDKRKAELTDAWKQEPPKPWAPPWVPKPKKKETSL